MKKSKNKIRLIGRREYVNFPELKVFSVEAKIDTGAYTSSIHCSDIVIKKISNNDVLCFKLLDVTHPELAKEEYQFPEFYKKKIKNSFGEMEERYIIKTKIKLGRKTIRTTLSLSDRENMRYPVLIGRRMLKGKFIIDVNKIHIGGMTLSKAINDYL